MTGMILKYIPCSIFEGLFTEYWKEKTTDQKAFISPLMSVELRHQTLTERQHVTLSLNKKIINQML